MLADLFINKPIREIDQLFSYTVPKDLEDEIQEGMRVQVPFGRGNRQEIGYVIRLRDEAPEEGKTYKAISQVLDEEPILTREALALGLYMRRTYLTTYVQAFSPLLPDQALGSIREGFVPIDKSDQEVQALFKDQEVIWARDLDPDKEAFARDLVLRGLAQRTLNLAPPEVRLKRDYYRLTGKVAKDLTPKQDAVFKYLKEEGPSLRKDILRDLGVSDSPLNILVREGLVEKARLYIPRTQEDLAEPAPPHKLNPDQAQVLDDILKDEGGTHLLHGVTGSGKTEVYLQLTQAMLDRGKTAIIILPEISLTPLIQDRFQTRFPGLVSIMHSRLSAREKTQEWVKMREGQSKIVIGARSALFSPLENLGLIVIDEEHEPSYGFHNQLRYDTRDLAEARAGLEGASLVLGSATPSIRSYYRAQEGDIRLHELKKRAVEGAQMPQIDIVDMRSELARGNVSIFSQALYDSLGTCLDRGNQAILFLNRRGYSHFVSCRACGHTIKCDHCDISMSYHQSIGRLLCHYCGSTKRMVTTCPECGSPYIKEFGVGTEQLEALVREAFPRARVLRMDSDTMTAKDSYDQVYQAMTGREVDILIGTQMLTKGFDYEDVTLVAAVAADSSLNFPDYSSAERTFQLLTQVGGRAGRSKKAGKVLIQTYQPDHYALKRVKEGDYKGFYQEEVSYRRLLSYPPFVKLFYVRIRSRDLGLLKKEVQAWEATLRAIRDRAHIEMEIGLATEAPMIKNTFSYQIQVKCPLSSVDMLLHEFRRVLNNYNLNIKKKDVSIDIVID